MAKKEKKGKEFSFSEIGSLIESSIEKTSILVETETNQVKKELIGTGVYILNAMFSTSIFGGIQSNRITAIAGASGTGKSFLCYNICREAQKKDWNIIYIDTEFSIEFDQLPNFGIDVSPDRFKLVRTNVVEDLKLFLASFLKGLKDKKDDGYELPKFLIVLDSAGQMASRKEVNDAIEGKEKADMTRAKTMGSLFRIINSDLGYLNIPMIVTNHTYQTMDMFPQEIMKGGNSLVYTASTIVYMSKAQLKTGEEDEMDMQSGLIISAKSKKNRLAKPKKVKFELSFTSGCNPYKGLEAFCIPEFFDKIGIAVGKMEVDKSTGEMIFKPGGNQWYVRHLDKKIAKSQLHTKEVFTQEVLEALEPIIKDYFSYKSFEEMQELSNELKEYEDEFANSLKNEGIDVNDLSDKDLFN
jgi:RecA/RadA recombinase